MVFALYTHHQPNFSQESKSEASVKEIYTAMRNKTHLNNALYQNEHELVIAGAPAGS